jgi:hypothetical protein
MVELALLDESEQRLHHLFHRRVRHDARALEEVEVLVRAELFDDEVDAALEVRGRAVRVERARDEAAFDGEEGLVGVLGVFGVEAREQLEVGGAEAVAVELACIR